MNENVHLVPRHIILNVMKLLEENNLVAENEFAAQQHDILNRITEKTPDNLHKAIA